MKKILISLFKTIFTKDLIIEAFSEFLSDILQSDINTEKENKEAQKVTKTGKKEHKDLEDDLYSEEETNKRVENFVKKYKP